MPDRDDHFTVHPAIRARFRAPYWSVSVSRSLAFPPEQYPSSLPDDAADRNQLPCGHCQHKTPALFFLSEVMSNAGGTIRREFRCDHCEAYTLYEEEEFS